MYGRHKVFCIDWCDTEENAHIVTCHGPEEAIQDWCKYMDDNSNFVDGYPDCTEVEVIDPIGVRSRHNVYTDWHPSFYSVEKESA